MNISGQLTVIMGALSLVPNHWDTAKAYYQEVKSFTKK